MVAGEPSPIDQGVELRLVMKDGAYWIYDPTGLWVGSLISLASGIGLCLVGRKLRKRMVVSQNELLLPERRIG
jgi:hypothetical protein